MMAKTIVVQAGDRYHELTIVREVAPVIYMKKSGSKKGYQNKSRRVVATCNCGSGEKEYHLHLIRTASTRSCGCLGVVHGMSKKREHNVWCGITQRCTNPSNEAYAKYGALGMDSDFHDFEVFYRHVGPCPNQYSSIDRINNEIGYFRGNVRWATRKEQGQNKCNTRRWIVKGVEFDTARKAADHYGVGYTTIRRWCGIEKTGCVIKKRSDCYAELKYPA